MTETKGTKAYQWQLYGAIDFTYAIDLYFFQCRMLSE